MIYSSSASALANSAATTQNDAGAAAGYQMSGNPLIDAMLPGYAKWGSGGAGTGATVSFSFPWANGTAAVFNTGGAEHTAAQTRAMSPEEQAVVRSILQTVSQYANITFVEVQESATQVGTLRFAFSSELDSKAYGWAAYPGNSDKAGDMWFSIGFNAEGVAKNGYLIAHELNHALGLKHYYDGAITISEELKIPFYGGGRIDWAFDPATRDYVPTYANAVNALSMDVQALQYLYGPNMTHNAGDTVHRWKADTGFLDTVWDAGGHDVFDFSNFTTDNIINLNAGSFSTIRGAIGFWDSSYAFNASTINNLYLLPGAVIEDANGGSGNDTITGNALANVLRGNGGNDTIVGGAGNDVMYGGTGNNTLDGGAGVDFAAYDGARNSVTLTRSGANIVVTTTNGSAVDTLISVERLKFAEGNLALDIGAYQIAGSAYRLYQAAFDRVPDVDGLSYWIRRMDAGADLKTLADNFLAAAEFTAIYGTPQSVTNTRFIELLYTNTLGRTYDQAGFNYWVDRLGSGGINRGDLLAFFSESEENQARVSSAIADGIWYV